MHFTPKLQGRTRTIRKNPTLITPYQKPQSTAASHSRTTTKNSQAGITTPADLQSLIQYRMIPIHKPKSTIAHFAEKRSDTKKPSLSRFHTVWSRCLYSKHPQTRDHSGRTF